MKKYIKLLSLTILFLFIGCSRGNSIQLENKYNIGHDSLKFKDLKRNDTIVTAELFYPSKTKDEQISMLEGKFPLIIFANGYQQTYDDYQYIWENLVTNGYIVAFITTQQGLFIDIDAYALDINFLLQKLSYLSKNIILMGHSTGGGAIYIAQSINPQAIALVSLAALGEPYGSIYGTSPIESAKKITVPSLVISGSSDCITKVNKHQKPIYDNLNGEKTMITIKDGDHCGFTNPNFQCLVGESILCGVFFQGSTIDDREQRNIVIKTILDWLK